MGKLPPPRGPPQCPSEDVDLVLYDQSQVPVQPGQLDTQILLCSSNRGSLVTLSKNGRVLSTLRSPSQLKV